jgi:hypothetical protein
MAHRTTIWRRKQRQDFSLDSELTELKRPKEPKDWQRVTLCDGSKRYIPKAKLFLNPSRLGRREKSEAEERETLDLVAHWIAEEAMRISPGYGSFPLKAAARDARKEIGKLPYKANMIAAAAIDGLRLGRIQREQARISRRMMCHWKKYDLRPIKREIAIQIDVIKYF